MFFMSVGLFIWYIDVILTRYIHDTFAAYRDILKRIITLVIKQVIMIMVSNTIFIIGVLKMQGDGF